MWPEDAITSRPPLSYRDAGVDIDAGDALVQAIKPLAAATRRPGALGGLGGFGGLFDLKAAGFHDPILVATNDGVGTKLKVAIASGRHDTIGVDLVAMCVNDLVVQGAEPLLFLDYYATGRLDVEVASAIIAGIAEGCRVAGCVLSGGETAEMPGLYAEGDYDLAGFALGAAERDELLDGRAVSVGDLVLGLASDGLHSNGFSLVRKLIAEAGLALDASAPFEPERTLGEALLVPTRIYAKACLAALRAAGANRGLRALAHITGGGLVENLPRVLPAGTAAELDRRGWPQPAVFTWLAESGRIAESEMLRTFNCGIGMAAIVAPAEARLVSEAFAAAGEQVYQIGEIVARDPGEPPVRFRGSAPS